MSKMDIIQVVVALLTIIISVIALFQANKSKQISQKANDLSEEVLRDTQKEYMPVIQFTGKIKVIQKDIQELSNELTFDFFNTINHVLSRRDEDTYWFEEKFNCICIELENIGKGISTGISINGLDIIFGNKFLYDYNLEDDIDEDDLEYYCHLTGKSENLFIMNSGDKAKINLLISNDYAEPNQLNENYSKFDSDIEKDKDKIENLDGMIKMSLFIGSLNNNSTEYSETDLTGTYVDGKITNCSFSKYEKIN
jgi:hypothetical protein